MIIRIFIGGFASLVAGMSYLTGLASLMTGLLIGFGAFSSFFLGLLFALPVESDRRIFPVYERVEAWPYFTVAAILLAMVVILFFYKGRKPDRQAVSACHFKYFLWGIGCYLATLFLSSVYWFPSDEKRIEMAASALTAEVLGGTCFYLAGVTASCVLFYLASRGGTEDKPDLMRRFVLAFFTFFQFDKLPLLVAYLLIYSPETEVIFPNIAGLALASYIPVGCFLLKTTLDAKQPEPGGKIDRF
ncbi:hypothetical protein [Desulforhopalus singaporensis]|uniref:Uncharacterized protein n=1 Tax=Desulforhopalus singaporensis TaxID=91360 RepID=A0A1H0LYI3_9BACT|nr:hypothetical protein [Desulforhopalus singaporensis]SDO73207.1 hypothetical protein SAMN05660330_00906 [Desulforhopalus singaporensis]